MTNNYRSNAEELFADSLTESSITFQYEEFKLPYVVSKHYCPDFFLTDYGFFVEYKGYFKPADRKKHLLIKKQHPTIDLRFVFQNPWNRLNKRSKTTYADWCDRHGFLWAEGSLPKSWLKIKK